MTKTPRRSSLRSEQAGGPRLQHLSSTTGGPRLQHLSSTTGGPHLFQHQSFEIGYRKLALPVMKFLVKRMGGDQVAAEEVFARTISAAWAGWHKFRHKSSYFTWICRIGLNKIADYYRDQVNDNSRWVLPILEEASAGNPNELTPTEKLSLAELKLAMGECLNLLPSDKRQLLQFRFWRELSIKEMATIFHTSERSIEGKIYRAKKTLKKILSRKYPELIPEIATSLRSSQ